MSDFVLMETIGAQLQHIRIIVKTTMMPLMSFKSEFTPKDNDSPASLGSVNVYLSLSLTVLAAEGCLQYTRSSHATHV